ncbi:MAG: class I SAM-dependent methyltransferase [Sulfitobacter sp.]|tara:strand:- start:3813 stop:4649 length:837 start_codon:yes stop_codon:yes gene_type:complete
MTSANSDQEEFWTSNAGPTWVEQENDLDQLLSPVLDRVLENGDLLHGHSVLDIGCGTGQSTLRAGALVGHTGHVLGADISSTMIARAKQRAEDLPQVDFALVDAEAHSFAPARFDRAISRFGVMFFSDTTAAFRNIAAALKPGGRISFATWGQTQANPWFTLPAAIAKAELGAPPKTDPDAPGPFALRDIDKTCSALTTAGLTDVTGTAQNLRLTLPGGADQIANLSMKVGPASGTMKHFEASQSARDRIEAAMRKAFGEFDDHAVPAEINFFTATKS